MDAWSSEDEDDNLEPSFRSWSSSAKNHERKNQQQSVTNGPSGRQAPKREPKAPRTRERPADQDEPPAQPAQPSALSTSRQFLPPGKDKIFHKSALCVIPPQSFHSQIDEIRKVHDKAYPRWMPHINLMYPFYDEAYFKDIENDLRNELKDVPSFKVSLKRFSFFKMMWTSTVWLQPEQTESNDDSGPGWNQLFNKLSRLYPECVPAKKADSGFIPHLTVGQSGPSPKDAESAIEKFSKTWQPFTFTVDRVYLISRNDDNFTIKYEIPLKT